LHFIKFVNFLTL
jgi:hypothetical protein